MPGLFFSGETMGNILKFTQVYEKLLDVLAAGFF